MSTLVSVSEAADELGVSASHVYRLIEDGRLRGTRAGSSHLVFAESLHEYQLVRPRSGRPFSPGRAWDILLDAKPETVDDLGILASRCRRRAEPRYVSVLDFRLRELAGSSRVVLSGADGAAQHHAAIGTSKPVQLYILQSDLESISSEFRIRESADMNVILRVVPNDAWPFMAAQHLAPLVVCAVDAYSVSDLRSAHEAITMLRAR